MPAASRRTALLIEADPALRSTVARLLVAEGWAIREASDGATGIRLALAERPDLILLDLGLPDIGGATLRQRVQAH